MLTGIACDGLVNGFLQCDELACCCFDDVVRG